MMIRRTVWHKDSMPLVPPLYRPIFTVFLPFVDGMMILFAIGALFVGSGVVRTFTVEWFPYAWAGLIGAGAILASIGIIFQLDHTELAGKFFLSLAMFVYAVLLAIDAFQRNPPTILSIIPVLLVLGGLVLRMVYILVVIGRREAAHE